MATSKDSGSEEAFAALMNVKLQDTRDRLLILRQLKQRFSELNDELQTQIQALSLEQLYALGEALLDSSASTDIFAP